MADWVGQDHEAQGRQSVGIMYLNVSEDIARQGRGHQGVAEARHRGRRASGPGVGLARRVAARAGRCGRPTPTSSCPSRGRRRWRSSCTTPTPSSTPRQAGYPPTTSPVTRATARSSATTSRTGPTRSPRGASRPVVDPENAEGANTPEQQAPCRRDEQDQRPGVPAASSGATAATTTSPSPGGCAAGSWPKAAAELGADLTREGFKNVLESQRLGLRHGRHPVLAQGQPQRQPYSFNREFVYKWVSHRTAAGT